METPDWLLAECSGCWKRHHKAALRSLFGEGRYCPACKAMIEGLARTARQDIAPMRLRLRPMREGKKGARHRVDRPDVMVARVPPRRWPR